MSDENLLPIEVFYLMPFVLGPIIGCICGMVMSNIRVWHGLLLGVAPGPVMLVPTLTIAIISWVNTGTDDMTAGAHLAHLMVVSCVIPATWALCFLVSRVREEANVHMDTGGRSPSMFPALDGRCNDCNRSHPPDHRSGG